MSPTDSKSHPYKQLRIGADGTLSLFDPRGADIIARQQLDTVHHRNGAAYAITRECLLEQKTILGARTGAVVIEEPMLSIDTEADFQAVERVLREREAAGEPEKRHVPARTFTFVCDVDGVLAGMTPGNDYTRSQPLRDNIARINALKDAGHRVVLCTARGSASGKDWLDHTRSQMDSWGVRYDELRVGKPAADYYIDDRLVTPHEALAIAGISGDPGQASQSVSPVEDSQEGSQATQSPESDDS